MRIIATIGAALSVAALALSGPLPTAEADTDGLGCETIRWGFLGSQRRTICDQPRLADGSWFRQRRVWTPAHYVPIRTSCYGTYSISCTTSGGYHVELTIQGSEDYWVTDATVLPDEPGWLPTGSDIVR